MLDLTRLTAVAFMTLHIILCTDLLNAASDVTASPSSSSAHAVTGTKLSPKDSITTSKYEAHLFTGSRLLESVYILLWSQSETQLPVFIVSYEKVSHGPLQRSLVIQHYRESFRTASIFLELHTAAGNRRYPPPEVSIRCGVVKHGNNTSVHLTCISMYQTLA